jgi:hypothetical protein
MPIKKTIKQFLRQQKYMGQKTAKHRNDTQTYAANSEHTHMTVNIFETVSSTLNFNLVRSTFLTFNNAILTTQFCCFHGKRVVFFAVEIGSLNDKKEFPLCNQKGKTKTTFMLIILDVLPVVAVNKMPEYNVWKNWKI